MKGLGSENKRDFIRIPMDAELSYKETGTENLLKGTGVNLSHNGLQFIAEKPLRVGAVLDIIIKTGGAKFAPLIARMTVIRVEPMADKTYKIAGKMEVLR